MTRSSSKDDIVVAAFFEPLVVLFLTVLMREIAGIEGSAISWLAMANAVLWPLSILIIVGLIKRSEARSRSEGGPAGRDGILVGYGLYSILVVLALLVSLSLLVATITLGLQPRGTSAIANAVAGLLPMFTCFAVRQIFLGSGVGLGVRHLMEHKPDQASEAFMTNLNRRPHDWKAWMGGAMAHLIGHDPWTALECAQRATELNYRPETVGVRGQCLASMGLYGLAEADLVVAQRGRRTLPADQLLGMCLIATRRLTLAINLLEKATWLSPTLAGRLALAAAYELAGREVEAEASYQMVAESNEKDDESMGLVALAKVNLRSFAEAQPIAEELSRRDPFARVPFLVLFECALASGDEAAAWRTLVSIALRSPADVRVLLLSPHYDYLFTEARYRELFIACERRVRQDEHRARGIIGRSVRADAA